jgi:hypothetical protein
MALVPFNQDLNRLMLVVKGGKAQLPNHLGRDQPQLFRPATGQGRQSGGGF